MTEQRELCIMCGEHRREVLSHYCKKCQQVVDHMWEWYHNDEKCYPIAKKDTTADYQK